MGPPEVSISPDPAPEPHRAEPRHLANHNEPPPPGEMEAGPYMVSEPPIRSADSGPQGYHMPMIGHPPPIRPSHPSGPPPQPSHSHRGGPRPPWDRYDTDQTGL
ncbi:basic salivary proline-rich protein 1-like [Oncorhynchus nerka]|uniref:basic salivary proline-rich protein 1-like n=1 Tax=Oncorhynchus nerka TaxID=8023 RepID=UPI0031B86CBF